MKIIILLLFISSGYCLNYTDIIPLVDAVNTRYFQDSECLWECANGICSWWESARMVDTINDLLHALYFHGVNNNFTHKLEKMVDEIYNRYANVAACNNCTDIVDYITGFIQCDASIMGYYDDEAWWGLAWMRAYERTRYQKIQRPEYLNISIYIHQHMTNGWNNDCLGGIPWTHCGGYKAAIQNELYILLSTKLYLYTRDNYYYKMAERGLGWFLGSGILDDNYSVNGGLDISCNNDRSAGYTYNQGIILPALAYLNGNGIADKMINNVIGNSSKYLFSYILREIDCEFTNSCDENSQMFKGIYIQYLKDYYMLNPSLDIKKVIIANAYAIQDVIVYNSVPLSWVKNPTCNNPITFKTSLSAITALTSYLWVSV